VWVNRTKVNVLDRLVDLLLYNASRGKLSWINPNQVSELTRRSEGRGSEGDNGEVPKSSGRGNVYEGSEMTSEKTRT
jgi:hypothetical protein